MLEDILPLLGVLVIMAAILVLAYYATRVIATRGAPGLPARRAGQGLCVLEQLMLSREVKLVLTQAGERYFLLAVSPTGADMIAEFTAEQAARWQQEDEAGQSLPSFREAFLQQLRQRKK